MPTYTQDPSRGTCNSDGPTPHNVCSILSLGQVLVQAMQWWSDRSTLSLGMPFRVPMPTITITLDANMEGWGGHSIVPGSGATLFGRLNKPGMPAPYQWVRALGSSSNPPTAGAGTLIPIDCNQVWQYSYSVIHQKTARSSHIDPQYRSLTSVPLGNSPSCPDEGDSSTGG